MRTSRCAGQGIAHTPPPPPVGENRPVITGGRGRTGGLRRGQRGVVSVRVLLALAVSTVVTVAVSGPMAFQAYQANSDDPRPTPPRPRRAPPRGRRSSPRPPCPAASPWHWAGPPRSPPPRTAPAPPHPTPADPPSPPSPAGRRLRHRPRPPPPDRAPPPPDRRPPPSRPGPRPWWNRPGPPRPPPSRYPATASCSHCPPASATCGPSPAPWSAVGCGSTSRAPAWTWSASGSTTPPGPAAPANTEEQSPYTLVRGPTNGQPGSWDSTTVADGQHSVLTEVVTTTGSSYRRLAVFTVSNIDD